MSIVYPHFSSPLRRSKISVLYLRTACVAGCVLAGPLMERIGRKKTLMLVAMGNYAIGFTCILLADRAEFIYVGRSYT